MGHCAEWCLRRNYGGESVIQVGQIHSLRDGGVREWVLCSRLGIRKATLTFVAKFLRLLVRSEGVCAD
ncbi:hypothetical protein H5410_061904 [Solanum commersonii]|uniref:Uncharacterized protein n=1 Tax=Solanum commersonii TaxID=4109 RepID=A0A9J5W9B2_SOLCO|nr:hypothetical protein H5410_061904 [Solanum commersonii]